MPTGVVHVPPRRVPPSAASSQRQGPSATPIAPARSVVSTAGAVPCAGPHALQGRSEWPRGDMTARRPSPMFQTVTAAPASSGGAMVERSKRRSVVSCLVPARTPCKGVRNGRMVSADTHSGGGGPHGCPVRVHGRGEMLKCKSFALSAYAHSNKMCNFAPNLHASDDAEGVPPV